MDRWPFLGREHILTTVVENVRRASVVLVGPAGIGKSRLATAALEQLGEVGVTNRRLVGSASARGIPLLAVRPLIGEASTGDLVAGVHERLGLTTLRPGPGDPVILVDDAGHFDDASAAVLLQVAAAGRVHLLVTIRPEQAVGSALLPLLRSDTTTTLVIDALPDSTAESIITEALGSAVDGRSMRQIVDAANGNPMLLRELVVGARSSAALAERNGLWTLAKPLPATPILDDLVAERIRPLNALEFEALELIVVGGPLGLALISDAVELGSLESLEQNGLIEVRSGPAGSIVDVRHPIYRDVLNGRLGALARLRCHRQLAELAEQFEAKQHTPAASDELLQASVWRHLGGLPLDADRALEAARIASARKDPHLAAELAIASYRTRPGAHAAILATWSLATTGRQREALTFLAEASGEMTQPDERAALVLRYAEELWWWAREPARAMAVLQENAEAIGPGPWADLLRAQPAVFSALNGDGREAVAVASRFADHELLWVRRVASIGLGFGLVICDRGDEAIAVSEQAFNDALTDPLQQLSGDPAIHIVCRLFAGLYGPDAGATLELAKSIYGIAVEQPAPQSRAWAAMLLGMAHLAFGRPRSAARLCTEAEVLWSDCGIQGLARWSASSLVLAQLAAGDPTAAREARDRMLTYDQTGFAFNRTFEVRGEAHLAFLDGNRELARTQLIAEARREAGRGAFVLSGDLVYELVRLGLTEDAANAIELLGDGGGALTTARTNLLRALSPFQTSVKRRSPSTTRGASTEPVAVVTLDSVAEEFGLLQRNLEAAEIWALASRAHEANGDAKQAAVASARAASLTENCEHARPPLLVRPPTVKLLSAREFEIAGMAGLGHSNRAIATELVVSERTVESHLYRVFAKLGVTSRDKLTEELDKLR